MTQPERSSDDPQAEDAGNLGGPPTRTIPRTPGAEADGKQTPRGKDYGTDDDTPQQGGM